MSRQETTFQSTSFRQRVNRVGRLLRRVQYPLSENSEPIFDLERYGASSRHSGSTRRSVSTFRRATYDDSGSPLERTATRDVEEDEKVDIIVVEQLHDEHNGSHKQHSDPAEQNATARASDQESTRLGDHHHTTFNLLTSRIIPFLKHFFDLSFQDPVKERHYLKENWFLSKRICIFTSLFFYIAWGLILGFYPRPWHTFDLYAWIGIIGLFVIPILPAILLDMPQRYPWLWRLLLFFATWSWSFLIALQLTNCGYYTSNPRCGSRDFVGLFFYLLSMPTMALLVMRQSRLFHLLGTLGALLFIAIAIIPIRKSWVRHFFNFLLFQVFMLYISYAREKSDRKIFNLRDQLKVQYKATQKAQVAESRASDLKKRFVNYIFHEVRVPLNTALLSLQNLIGEDAFKDAPEDQIELVDVLQGSLGMMEKVLNDVLDFNRMESGKLLCATTPFDFLKVIKSVLLGLEVAASSKSINLTSELDPRIEHLGELLGDEMRLRQVLSNLASNACKFTNPGGRVILKTKVFLRKMEHDSSTEESPKSPQLANQKSPQLTNPKTPQLMNPKSPHITQISNEASSLHDRNSADGMLRGKVRAMQSARAAEKVTIRIEVHDTGGGIRAQDIRDDRLFTPYVQTEIGKRQGGKGTGLGLALVRNIVQLSKGRLGLQSRVGKGSIFWIEMDYAPVDPNVLIALRLSQDSARDRTLRGSEADEVRISTNEKSSDDRLLSNRNEVAKEGSNAVTSGMPPPQSTTPPLTSSTAETVFGSDTVKKIEVDPPVEQDLSGRPSLTQLHSSEIEVLHLPTIVGTPTIELPRPFSPADAFSSGTCASLAPQIEIDSNSPLQVLVVDDDLLTRRLMTRMITRLGHTVESAENGQLALDCLRKHNTQHNRQDSALVPFDLVFLDNQMPVLSGVEMVTRARLEGIETIVCGVTGNAMKEDQDEFIESGADYVLTKPVLEASVKLMLQKAKDRRQQAIADRKQVH